MPAVRDFRRYRFDARRIDRCGRFVGRHLYWKLYATENLLRLVLHSVLAVQIGPDWWSIAVDPRIQQKALQVRERYVRKRWPILPGGHDIYCIFLTDLNNILRANSNLFLPVMPDVDQWIAKLEGIVFSRNLVGHMNFPGQTDRQLVDEAYRAFSPLLTNLQVAGIQILIP